MLKLIVVFDEAFNIILYCICFCFMVNFSLLDTHANILQDCKHLDALLPCSMQKLRIGSHILQ